MSSQMGLSQLEKLGKLEQYLWKISLVLHWEVPSHCIVAKAVKKKKIIPYVPPSEEIRVLQFEDTLLEMDCRSFNL